MSLPESKTLVREDFPEQAGWIDKLLRPLNAFIASTASAFQGALLYGQNVQIEERTFATSPAVADAFPMRFAIKMRARPQSLVVGRIEDVTDGGTFPEAVFPSWELTRDEVRVTHLTGLSDAKKYRILFEVKG
jgi:hypothetical protein